MLRILCQGEYIDAPQQAKLLYQPNSICDSIIEKLFMHLQIITKNNDAESSNDILITDKSAKHAPVSREKKLAKKLKN